MVFDDDFGKPVMVGLVFLEVKGELNSTLSTFFNLFIKRPIGSGEIQKF